MLDHDRTDGKRAWEKSGLIGLTLDVTTHQYHCVAILTLVSWLVS